MRGPIFSMLCALAMGCAVDPAPQARVVEVMPLMLDPARHDQDDVTITVEYHDADGDLGEGVAAVADCRAADLLSRFPIPRLAQQQAVEQGVSITGRLVLQIQGVAAVAPGGVAPPACAARGVAAAPGQVVFCVSLTDHAGNQGEPDCTPAVTL